MKKLYLLLVLSVLFFSNSICAQSTSTQKVNPTALNTIMNQGYIFKGIVGDCIIVCNENMYGILKTDGQWLIKPNSEIRVAPFYNVILYENNNDIEESEEKKIFDGHGNELISTKFYRNTPMNEIGQMEYKYHLKLINCLFEQDNIIQKLSKPVRVSDISGKIKKALDEGYLINNSYNVLDKNGSYVFKDEEIEYCGKGIFYLNKQNIFVNAANKNEILPLNKLLEEGYTFSQSIGNCIILNKDAKETIVTLSGQRIINTEDPDVSLHII